MYGWTMDYVLEMPARSFFAMKEAGRKIHAEHMAEMCQVAAVSWAGKEYTQDLIKHYNGIAIDFKRSPQGAIVMDATDPKAAAILNSTFKQKLKVMNGRN